ncbi:MAG: putative colanic acid biosynthesis acetyltransferase [Kiritimatiellia bacterium]
MTSIKFKRYQNQLTLKNKLARFLWNTIALFFFRLTPTFLFNKWRIFVLRCCGATIGKHCFVPANVKIWAPWNITLGDYVALGAHTELYSVARITIGSAVTISQGAYLCTASHDISYRLKPLITKPITIGNFCWVCADSAILPGVNLGEGSVAGLRAVVTKSVSPWTVVAGNPARKIRKRVLREDKLS